VVPAVIVAGDEFPPDRVPGPLQETTCSFGEIAGILMQGDRHYGFCHHIANGLIGKCTIVILAEVLRTLAEGTILIVRHRRAGLQIVSSLRDSSLFPYLLRDLRGE